MTTSSPDTAVTRFRTVTVLGAGTMGRGIAQVCASSGLVTRLFDVDGAQRDRAMASIRTDLAKAVDKGKSTPERRDAALDNLSLHASLERAIPGADMVVEAVPERIDLKRELLSRCAALASDDVVLATNTSSLSIDAIAQGVPRPERVIGTHFFNPVPLMKLLEVVVGSRTDELVVTQVLAFGAALGKECIRVKDSPGFATSRLGLVIGLEAIRMVEEGVGSVEDIDKAMVLGYGFPMGPLRLTDLVGLDVRLAIAEYLSTRLPHGEHFRPPKLLRELVATGKLGKKTGRGFYDWP